MTASPLRRLAEEPLVLRRPRAEHHELHSEVEQSIERRDDEVEALLLGKPRDGADERRARIRRQPELTLQRFLVFRLPFKVLASEGGPQERVARRVPDRHVNAVQHAMECVGALPQLALEAVTVIEDLFRVGRRHGGHEVGRQDPAAQEVQLIAPHVGLERRVGKADDAGL